MSSNLKRNVNKMWTRPAACYKKMWTRPAAHYELLKSKMMNNQVGNNKY